MSTSDDVTDPVPFVSPARARAIFLVFAALFCASGLVYSLTLGETLRYPDERDYIALARHLAAFDGYTFDGQTPTAHRPPGYPVLLAPVVALIDSVHAVRVANFAMLALAAYLLAGLVHERRARVGRWNRASLVLALTFAYPVLYYTSGTLFAQISIALALTLAIVLLQRRGNSAALAALIGALIAFTAQISPTTLVLLPVALLFAIASRRWSGSRVLVMGLAAALVFGGWFTRNVIVMDEPILFSKNLAENLDNAVLVLDPLEPGEERPPAAAIDYALERLEQTIGSPLAYLERFGDFFASSNEMNVAEERSRTRDLIMFVTYYGLLVAVLVRLALARRLPPSPAEWLVIALYIGTALFHALLIPRIRYRLPLDFLLLLPVANLVLFAFSSWRERHRSTAHVRSGAGAAPRRTARRVGRRRTPRSSRRNSTGA